MVTTKKTASASKGFTGKVEESFEGKPQATTYYFEGKEIAKTSSGGGGSSSSYSGVPSGTYNITLPSEEVKITPQQITTSTFGQRLTPVNAQSKVSEGDLIQVQTSKQISPPVIRTGIPTGRGTRMIEPQRVDSNIYLTPTITATQTGTEFRGGKEYPIIEYNYVDPYGKKIGQASMSTTRKATPEEVIKLKEQYPEIENQIKFKPTQSQVDFRKRTGVVSPSELYSFTEFNLSQSLRKNVLSTTKIEKAGNIAERVYTTRTPLAFGGAEYFTRGSILRGGGRITKTVVVANLKDISEKPIKQIALVGGGVALGGAVKGIKVASVFVSPKTYQVTKSALNVGGLALGSVYVGKTVGEISQSKNIEEAIGKTSVVVKDTFLFGGGYAVGTRASTKIVGELVTMNRELIPQKNIFTQDIIEGKSKVVLKRGGESTITYFKKQEYALSGRKGLQVYHVTPNKVPFGKGFIASKGSSEIAGLYVAPSPSIYFAKISGISNYKLIGLEQEGVLPAILNLRVKGFRNVQTFRIGKNNYVISQPLKKGYVDIPNIKSEAEGIIRVGETYSLTGQRYYTEFKGVRVPIEEYKYYGTATKITSAIKQTIPSKIVARVTTNLGSMSSSTIPSTPIINQYLGYSSLFKTSRGSILKSYSVAYSNVSSTSPIATSRTSIVSPTIIPKISYNSSSSISTSIPSSPTTPTIIPPTSLPKSKPSTLVSSNQLKFFILKKPEGVQLADVSKVVKGGRVKFGYVPSYSAIIYKIKGKKPTGVETGISFRPITKGFSFTKSRLNLLRF